MIKTTVTMLYNCNRWHYLSDSASTLKCFGNIQHLTITELACMHACMYVCTFVKAFVLDTLHPKHQTLATYFLKMTFPWLTLSEEGVCICCGHLVVHGACNFSLWYLVCYIALIVCTDSEWSTVMLMHGPTDTTGKWTSHKLIQVAPLNINTLCT